jgi:RNA polymerase sigma factor (sigma-70 family)
VLSIIDEVTRRRFDTSAELLIAAERARSALVVEHGFFDLSPRKRKLHAVRAAERASLGVKLEQVNPAIRGEIRRVDLDVSAGFSKEDTRELMQDTHRRLIKVGAFGKLKSVGQRVRYAKRAAHSACRDFLRHRARNLRSIEAAKEKSQVVWFAELRRDRLQRLISTLPESQQVILRHCVFAKQRIQDVAERCGQDARVLRYRLKQALQQLRAMLLKVEMSP